MQTTKSSTAARARGGGKTGESLTIVAKSAQMTTPKVGSTCSSEAELKADSTAAI